MTYGTIIAATGLSLTVNAAAGIPCVSTHESGVAPACSGEMFWGQAPNGEFWNAMDDVAVPVSGAT